MENNFKTFDKFFESNEDSVNEGKSDYYAGELSKINTKSEYLPTLVITDADGNKTKHLSLSPECREELMKWLKESF